jgi:bacterioferritin-associated ferredoxin
MYLCVCKGLTEQHVQQLGGGETEWTADGLIAALGLHDPVCCGRCARQVHELLAVVNPRVPLTRPGTVPAESKTGERHAGQARGAGVP